MFILLPVGVNYQTDRLPIVTFVLMGINVLVYIGGLIFGINGGEEAQDWIFQNLWLIPNESAWHAYLTSMFVHAGFFHLLGNMMYLFLFGSCVEDVIGRWKYLLFYLLGGLAAAFTEIAATSDHFASEIPFGGASGAVTACLGGFIVLLGKQEIDFRYFGFFFLRFFSGEFSLASWIVISFWFAKDLLFAALTFEFGQGHGGVAFAAHVGGFLAGLALIGVYKLIPRKKSEEEEAVQEWSPTLAQRAAALSPIPVEVNETPAIFISEGGAQSGPFTTQQIREMISLGSISADAYYWQEGMAEWSTVQDFST